MIACWSDRRRSVQCSGSNEAFHHLIEEERESWRRHAAKGKPGDSRSARPGYPAELNYVEPFEYQFEKILVGQDLVNRGAFQVMRLDLHGICAIFDFVQRCFRRVSTSLSIVLHRSLLRSDEELLRNRLMLMQDQIELMQYSGILGAHCEIERSPAPLDDLQVTKSETQKRLFFASY